MKKLLPRKSWSRTPSRCGPRMLAMVIGSGTAFMWQSWQLFSFA